MERFAAGPAAVRDLSYDSDLTGRVAIPLLTLHATGDPTAFVEHEAAYRDTLRGAHRDRWLVQTFTGEHEHSALSDAEYAASLAALDRWARTGQRTTPPPVAAACPAFDRVYATGCRYDAGYRPAPSASRVRPRPGGTSWPAMTAAQEKAWSRAPGVGMAP
ncbi:hypothetical protein GA0115245_116132 [Streptomyces sp. di188]|nr:hypothetical protein GA0115238_124723 [Streptomyces sp. di50b]SCD89553.1 hypothetical protein GA0115245_116132 [Streptomyces sp. di188]